MHPLTWWLWSALLATTLVRLQNSWLTIATIALVSVLVFKFKSDGPWADSYKWALKLALAVILFRVFIGIVIGVPVPGSVLFTIPTIPLPDWMAGITLGGAVTWERVSSTIIESLNIASIIALFGAATALTNPRAVLRSIPPIFYEVGMVLVIATTLTPQLVGNLKRIRIAQKMRGISTNRFLSWRQIAMPLLEDSLARALDLAAAMDSRGYGQSRKRSKYRPQKFAFRDLLFLSTSLAFLAVSI
ncbi:MAG: energy-coupling factor transporter transmembrane component T family protein [Candidatus Nanopelagicaceae bacterium]